MGFKSSLVRSFNRVKYKGMKHAPTILFITGIALDAFALYSFIKKSGKVNKIIEKHNEKIEELHNIPVMDEDIDEEYEGDVFESLKEKNQTITRQYLDTGKNVVKEVGPAAGAWVMSKVCYFHCKKILDARYLGAVAVGKSIKTQFDQYRKRNIELNGVEADSDCMYGKATDICEMAPEEEGGEITKTSVRYPENAIKDICTVWIDEESDIYDRDRTITKFNLKQQERWINKEFATNGFVNMYQIITHLGKQRCLDSNEVVLALNLGKVYDYTKTEEENWINLGIEDPVNADERNPIFTLHIDGMDILENVIPQHKQLGVYSRPFRAH